MTPQPRPTTPHDREPIIGLLTRAFGLGREAPFVNPSLLHWKYWEPRDDVNGARSLVVERDGRIVAHVGLWPRVAYGPDGRLQRGVHLIDWASEGGGSGALLVRHVMTQYDFVCAIGGSSATHSLLPKLGFRAVADSHIWARPLRPWQQVLRHQSRNARLPLRLVRNVIWSARSARPVDPSWGTVKKSVHDEFIAYLQRCPTARIVPMAITHNAAHAGYFVLAFTPRLAQLAGVWLEESTREHWRIAFELAQEAALHEANTCELVMRGAGRDLYSAAAAAGLRLRGRVPVYTYRRDGSTDPIPLRFQLWDDDSTFLAGPQPQFLT